VEGEGKLPDLILIDAQRQVSTAFEVLGELGLSDLPMIGVAKAKCARPVRTTVFPGPQRTAAAGVGHPVCT